MTERAITQDEFRAMLRKACDAAGGQAAWARKHGLSTAIVSYTVNGQRAVSEAIENALGYVRVIRYVPTKRRPNDA